MPKWLRDWRVLLSGIVGGFLYAFLEWRLDILVHQGSPFLLQVEYVFEWFIPILVGVLVAASTNLYIEQKRLNSILSTENAHLKSRILTNTLASYMLHEIRNPLHNLMAVIDRPGLPFSASDKAIIERNVGRLDRVTNQLKQLSLISDEIDAHQPVEFASWAEAFIESHAAAAMRKAGIRYELRLLPLRIKMHPLLLEQCFSLLFDNAVTAALAAEGKRSIFLVTEPEGHDKSYAVIRMSNTGSLFPEEVLKASGRYIVPSLRGSGLGLVLVRDTLKQAGGELSLANNGDHAEATLTIPLDS